MNMKIVTGCLFLLLSMTFPLQLNAKVDWSVYKSITLEAPPQDVAVSQSGKYIFVLTEKGEIYILINGKLDDIIKVGSHIDGIEAGPKDELLLLSSKKNMTLEVLALDFIKKINITDAPVKGPEEALVTIVVFSDFECEYCKQLAGLLDQVLEMYPNEVKAVFKNFPVRSHKFAPRAAAAALLAHESGKFWEFHDLVFENKNDLNDEKLQEIAEILGMDPNSFLKNLEDPKYASQVQQDLQDGRRAGVKSVPSVFVNGRTLKIKSMKGFMSMIEKALKCF